MLTLLAALLLFAQEPEPQARLQGTVVDGAGEPIPAAEVWVTSFLDGERALARGRTDGEGRYQLLVEATGVVLVHATTAGKVQAFVRTNPRFAARELPAIALWEGTTLRGRVTDAAGQPVAGATVAVGPTRKMILDIDQVEARTDAEGRYEL